jgi:hypothetical protein
VLEEPLQIIQIKILTPNEIQNIIQEEINRRKATGYGLIRGRTMKQMPRKGVVRQRTYVTPLLEQDTFQLNRKLRRT